MVNDDAVLDARDMAEEIEASKEGVEAGWLPEGWKPGDPVPTKQMEQARSGSEINGATLREAADSYARQFVNDYEFPSSIEHLQIQLQLAFNEGALWYNQKKLAKAEVELEAAAKKLEGLLK